MPTPHGVVVTDPPFYADPTGVVDATTAINSAIAAAAPGETVFFPTGTYKISVRSTTTAGPSIVLKSGVTLQGTGQANSIIRLADHQSPYWGLMSGPGWSLSNFKMYDLTIDANGLNNLPTFDDSMTYPRVTFVVAVHRCSSPAAEYV